MSTKTIDILLEMQTKPADINKMKAEFDALEKKAQNLQKAIDRVGNGKNADKLNASLAGVKSQIQAIDAEANKRILERNLAKAAEQANRTREKMEKLAQVGNRIALVGGAVLAPMVLAMKKYIELAKEDDPLANRFKEIGTQLTDFQVRFGKIVAEQVLPIAEKIIPVVDKVLSFLEANPKLVEFALVIGSALIVGAGIMSAIAQTMRTMATISGLFSDEARLATA